jgi:hypothetical protein
MASSTASTKEFAPREFNRNDQHLTQEGYQLNQAQHEHPLAASTGQEG